ncbi:MAG: hypothetical protein A2096_16205 [Spirochaetes bacterium GWF1_41_5]|nr:MAG: hypothetical protein A2096_16205 [Spirochaetes bacterium GWF1_41_5]
MKNKLLIFLSFLIILNIFAEENTPSDGEQIRAEIKIVDKDGKNAVTFIDTDYKGQTYPVIITTGFKEAIHYRKNYPESPLIILAQFRKNKDELQLYIYSEDEAKIIEDPNYKEKERDATLEEEEMLKAEEEAMELTEEEKEMLEKEKEAESGGGN